MKIDKRNDIQDILTNNTKMEQENRKTRSFAYTLNNYLEEDINLLSTIECKCHFAGREISESGTPHLQGFISFKNPRSWNSVRKMNDRWHIKPCIAQDWNNWKYVTKDGDPAIAIGEVPKKGKRTDIDEVKALVRAGASMREIAETSTSYQSIRCAEKLLCYMEAKRRWKPKVYWLHGDSGQGKTALAYSLCKSDPWVSGKNLKWWEGYDAHEYVIIDDYRRDFCTFHELLRILDRYEYRVEVKGGSRQLLAKTIIFTCPFHYGTLYESRTVEDLRQLERRLWCVIDMGTVGTEVGGNTSSPTFMNGAEQLRWELANAS